MLRRGYMSRPYYTAQQPALHDTVMARPRHVVMRRRMWWVLASEEHAFRQAFDSVDDVTSTGVVHTRCEKKESSH